MRADVKLIKTIINKNDETEIQYHNKHLHTPSA